MSFSSQVGDWVSDTTDDVAALHKAIIFELFTSVILDTPVLEGRLRGNWIVSFDSPNGGTAEISKTDSGSESENSKDSVRGSVTTKTVNNVFNELAKFPKGEDFSVFLTNNLPYAYRVEYDAWSHTKAPEGMVRKNVIRISQNLKST